MTSAVTFKTKDWCFEGVLSELQLLPGAKSACFLGLIVFCFVFESLNVGIAHFSYPSAEIDAGNPKLQLMSARGRIQVLNA